MTVNPVRSLPDVRVAGVERVLVVVPAHNEQDLLGECLSALQRAVRAVPIPTEVVVVLDACTDATAAVVGARGRVRRGRWRLLRRDVVRNDRRRHRGRTRLAAQPAPSGTHGSPDGAGHGEHR